MGLATSSNSKNIKLGIILSYINMGVSVLASFLFTDQILNNIGDYNYGLYSFVNSITTWLTVASSALTSSFIHFASIESNDKGEDGVSKVNTVYFKLLTILSITILVVGLSILLPMYLTHTNFGSYGWEDSQRIYVIFILSLINIAITMPVTVFSLYASFKQRFIYQGIMSILSTVLSSVGHLLLALLTKEIITFVIMSIALTFFFFFLNYAFCRKSLKMAFGKAKLADNKILVRSVLAFSGVLLFNSVVDQVNNSVDKTLLGFMASPEDVTIYQLAQNFGNYLITMALVVSGVFIPSVNEMVAKKDDEGINNLFLKTSRVQLLIVTLVTFGFLSCGKSFITLWIGEERINVYYVASGLMLSYICPLSQDASNEIQKAKNKHLFRSVSLFIFAFLNVGLSVLFLLIFPADKAIYACLLGTVITTFLSYWVSMNIYNAKVIKLPIKTYLFNLGRYLIIGGAAFGVVFLFDYLFINNIETAVFRFLIEGSIFVFLYAILFAILDHRQFMEVLNMAKQKLRRKKKIES